MFVLPPAPCSPYFQVNVPSAARTMPNGSCSTRTFDQSASISSAMIIGKEGFTPWPISGERAPMKVVPSFSMRTKRPIAGAESAEEGEAARASRGAMCKERSRPPAALAPSCMKVRRSRVVAESGLLMRRMLASIRGYSPHVRLRSSHIEGQEALNALQRCDWEFGGRGGVVAWLGHLHVLCEAFPSLFLGDGIRARICQERSVALG